MYFIFDIFDFNIVFFKTTLKCDQIINSPLFQFLRASYNYIK